MTLTAHIRDMESKIMRRWRRRGPNRRPKVMANGMHLEPVTPVPSRGPPPHRQGNSSGLTHTTNVAAVPTHPPAPSSAHDPGIRSRYNLLLPRAGPKTVPRTTVYGTTSRILPPS